MWFLVALLASCRAAAACEGPWLVLQEKLFSGTSKTGTNAVAVDVARTARKSLTNPETCPLGQVSLQLATLLDHDSASTVDIHAEELRGCWRILRAIGWPAVVSSGWPILQLIAALQRRYVALTNTPDVAIMGAEIARESCEKEAISSSLDEIHDHDERDEESEADEDNDVFNDGEWFGEQVSVDDLQMHSLESKLMEALKQTEDQSYASIAFQWFWQGSPRVHAEHESDDVRVEGRSLVARSLAYLAASRPRETCPLTRAAAYAAIVWSRLPAYDGESEALLHLAKPSTSWPDLVDMLSLPLR